MEISTADWLAYKDKMASLDRQAAELIAKWVEKNGLSDIPALIAYCFAVATKYSEGSGALAAAMYDTIAELSGLYLEPAEVAETPTYDDVSKTVYGILGQAIALEVLTGAIGRLVKRTGADTMLKNAKRDGAFIAWIPMGDTCAFCLGLAAEGWRHVGKDMVKNGHASHIHSNCDCTYGVKFNEATTYDAYNPDVYKQIYDSAEGSTPKMKINSMRRAFYAANSEEINDQKRDAYEKRKERESSKAEEVDIVPG